jgi:hypothetical protein
MSNESIEKYKKEFASKGGTARAEKLTAKQLSAIGKKAAAARWGTKKRAKKKGVKENDKTITGEIDGA